MQILHAGRYGNHDRIVSASPIRSPISRHEPHELTGAGQAADKRFFTLRRTGPGSRLRRGRDNGLRGILHQPVPVARERTGAMMRGAGTRKGACGWPWRWRGMFAGTRERISLSFSGFPLRTSWSRVGLERNPGTGPRPAGGRGHAVQLRHRMHDRAYRPSQARCRRESSAVPP